MKLPSARIRKHPLATGFVWLMLTFFVLFPKGGIKLGDLPITWGYILLASSVLPLALVRLVALPLRVTPRTLAAVATLIPFQILFVYSDLANGVANVSYAAGVFISFFVLPTIFLLIYPSFLSLVDGEFLSRQLRLYIFLAALFGIFLFFLYPITGHLIEVPYLTVNAADYGLIERTKHINRGLFLKLISTYNNGNVYGVATLILLPLYNVLEPRRWRRAVLKIALVLTLSRTVWAGLVIEQMLSFIILAFSGLREFPRVVAGAALRRGLWILGTFALVLPGLLLMSRDFSFLFDAELGGRVDTLSAFFHPSLLPSEGLDGLTEIVYASGLELYGVLGFFAILSIFCFPALLVLADRHLRHSPWRRAALKGLILYAIVACSDGAINFIPVTAFYWFAYMIFLNGWPQEAEWATPQVVPSHAPQRASIDTMASVVS